mgnify:CR=1 FL=1
MVDYLCPQIYWGCGYTLQSGSTRFAFENIVPEWLAMPRAASTALYFGLGAYRIGEGDGGANEDSQSQWCTGSALARQVERLHSLGAGRLGALPVRFAVPVGSAGACRRRTCGAGRSDYSLNSCMGA